MYLVIICLCVIEINDRMWQGATSEELEIVWCEVLAETVKCYSVTWQMRISCTCIFKNQGKPLKKLLKKCDWYAERGETIK